MCATSESMGMREVVQKYLLALEAEDISTIVALFEPEG
jgi:hypothetical protein